MGRWRDGWMEQQTDIQAYTDRQRQAYRQVGRQSVSQSGRQADSQEGGRSDVTNKCGNTLASVEI